MRSNIRMAIFNWRFLPRRVYLRFIVAVFTDGLIRLIHALFAAGLIGVLQEAAMRIVVGLAIAEVIGNRGDIGSMVMIFTTLMVALDIFGYQSDVLI